MDAASIEETNRLRAKLGMKPLPVPGAGPAFKKAATPEQSDEELASTLETRQAAAYDNYKKLKDAEDARKRRDDKNAAIKKARDAARRFENLEGKGLGEADDAGDIDAKSWLTSQKKRKKKIEKARKLEEELAEAEAAAAAAISYTSKDLVGVKVGHEQSAFEDGDEQILTLKDADVLGDEDGDELENVQLREHERLNERLESKKKRPAYDPHTIDEAGEHSILAQYDEEISGKKAKRFTLDAQGNSVPVEEADEQAQGRKSQKISLDFLKDDAPQSDYVDISEIKVKKPKKKSRQIRKRPADEDDIFPLEEANPQPAQSMDIDSGAVPASKKRTFEETNLVDDDDLQNKLAIQRRDALKKRKRTRPEDIALQLKEESRNAEVENDADSAQAGGLVIDEISEFVSGLKREDIEDRRPRSRTPKEPVTAMGQESDDDEAMRDRSESPKRPKRETSAPAEVPRNGVDEERIIGSGIGSALQLLRERNLLQEAGDENLNDNVRQQQSFPAKRRQKEEEFEQATRDQRDRDRRSERLNRMSGRDKEEWQRQQNIARGLQTSRALEDLFNKSYKPSCDIKYHDEFGRSLNKKEAWKHLSHQFHGKGSSKGKTDKHLKKVEDEKRRESQSMLDASQNVGISSATSFQASKRKEAGVRLG